MRTEAFRDTRLLDALEYIDDEYIASAARYKMKYTEETHEHKMTWRTPFKHWKQFVALAACLILLSVASPLANFISQAVSNFRAGAGSGSVDSTTQTIEEETNPFFWMYTPELEPLTQEQVDECNRAYRLKCFGTLEEYIATYPEEKKQYAEENYYDLVFIVPHRGAPYLGTFNGAIVSVWTSDAMESVEIVIGNYVMYFPTASGILVYKEGEICDIVSAYEKGWLTDDNIKTISERLEKYHKNRYKY